MTETIDIPVRMAMQRMLSGTPWIVLVLDEEGRIAFANHSPSESPGFVLARAREAAAEAMRTGSQVHFEMGETGPAGAIVWYDCVAAPIPQADGAGRMASVTCADVTERQRTADRLRRAEALMVDTQGTAHLGIWEWDVREPHATWSEELYKIYGLTPETYTPTYEAYLTKVHDDDRQRVIDATDRAFHEHIPYSHDERIIRPDGSIRHLHTWAHPILDEHGKLIRLMGVCQDITDRKVAEEQVLASLREKETLLREIHHRVKNNLQVISGLLVLQSGQARDEASRAVLADVQARVRAMALVHEKLYLADDLAHIDFADYVRGLSGAIARAHPDAARITMHLELEPAPFPIDVAVSLGLILNELLSNAYKHAFPAQRPGKIDVSLAQDAASGGWTLHVRDDGIGLPEDFQEKKEASLGWQLVALLTRQVGATLEVHGEHGTDVAVKLPSLADAAKDHGRSRQAVAASTRAA